MIVKEKLEMVFASLLGLKVGEGVPAEPLEPSPGYTPESVSLKNPRFDEKSVTKLRFVHTHREAHDSVVFRAC